MDAEQLLEEPEGIVLPLIKETDDGLLYFEGWVDEEEQKVVLHRGLVGETGEVREMPFQPTILETELARAREDGYKDISLDDLYQFVVQYRIPEDASVEQLDRCHQLEEVIHEALVWTGNGTLDGHDFGSGSFNIFAYVIDPDAAAEAVTAALEANGELEGAVIAFLNEAEGEEEAEYVVLWPDTHEGEFSLL